MSFRISRQVLDCGGRVREVTALALPALEIPKLAADTTTLPKAATPKTPSPQSKTLARRIASHSVHGPDARPMLAVEASLNFSVLPASWRQKNLVLPTRRRQHVCWEELTLGMAASKLDREQTTARVRNLIKKNTNEHISRPSLKIPQARRSRDSRPR